MNDLIATGHVERAILGVGIREISPEDADYVGLRQIRGVVVNDFTGKNSPARAAGLQPGDVIVALNDSTIDHVAQLQQMVGFRRPGETVRVTVVRRGGERHSYDVRVIAAPTGAEQVSANDSGAADASPAETTGKLGIAVEVPSADFVRQARLTEDQRGLVVADVEDGGPAYGKLLPPNAGPEVIVAVNDARIRTREEFQRALRDIRSGEVVSVRVYNVRLSQTRVVRIRARP
jgi:serine protease Do